MKIGIIGYGAIGQQMVQTLEDLGEADQLAGVLVRPGRDAPKAIHTVAALIAKEPDVVLECAGHGAVLQYGAEILNAGIDLVISSVGALADDQCLAELSRAEQSAQGRLLIPAGAVAGLDGLSAAQLAGIDQVTYISYKPPHAWSGTAAEEVIDLNHSEQELTFFTGSAREAALGYPKNANVSVAVALTSLGLDRTQVKLVSSNKVNDPLGVIEASGAFGYFRFEILGLAAANNPKTSALTAFSLIQSARLGNALPVSMLLTPCP